MRSRTEMFDRSHTVFSNNRKVSPRQIRRAMILELFGSSSLLLPRMLGESLAGDGIFALLAGGGGAWLLLMLWKVFFPKGLSGKESPLQQIHTLPQKIFAFLWGAGFLGLAAYVLYLLTLVIQKHLLAESFDWGVLLTLTLLAVFGLRKGLESRIRVYEVMFWFLLIPLLLVLVLALVNLQPAEGFHFFQSGKRDFLEGCAVSFLFFCFVLVAVVIFPDCSQPERTVRCAGTSLAVCLGLNVLVYVILLGTFGSVFLSRLDFPVITLMSVVKIPGGFFERQDALMVGIWYFCLFALFDSFLFYGCLFFQKVFSDRDSTDAQIQKGSGAGVVWWPVICGGITFGLAAWFLQWAKLAQGVFSFYLHCGGWAMIVMGVILYLLSRFCGCKKKIREAIKDGQ